MPHCSVRKTVKTNYVVLNEGRVIMSSVSFNVPNITSEVNYEYFFILLRNVCRGCCALLHFYREPITYLTQRISCYPPVFSCAVLERKCSV
jgi:hypothetical protein